MDPLSTPPLSFFPPSLRDPQRRISLRFGSAIGLCLLSGLLLALCFPPREWSGLAWIALLPAMAASRLLASWRWRLAGGYLLGLLFFGATLWWIGKVTIAGTIALVLYLALYPAFWLVLCGLWTSGHPPFRPKDNLLASAWLASSWVALEWVRGWLGGGFPWNTLGVSQFQALVFAQTARLGGALLLSWLLVFGNGLLFFTGLRFRAEIRGEQKRALHFDLAAGVLLLAGAASYGLFVLISPPTEVAGTLRYALIQPAVPQSVENPFDPQEAIVREITLTESASQAKPQLIVWPESPIGADLLSTPSLRVPLLAWVGSSESWLLLGTPRMQGERLYNEALLFEPKGRSLQTYAKNRLVPFGEFVPFGTRFPILRNLVPFELEFSPGAAPGIFQLQNPPARIAPLICFEDTFSDYARRLARQNPDLLVNITNDGWFTGTPGARQHLANAVFRTIELDLPLLRCGNTGITAFLNQNGAVVASLPEAGRSPEGGEGILFGTAQWHRPRPTLYRAAGDWIAWLSGAVLLFGIASALRRRKTPPQPRTT
ncbi:Apolipoprotein N-acyltransferase [Methylacidimicrobium cyclopophantes]|uniref:Apolipoprotein N-acyltransferase n=1 Tax=Methylacidimicrobium cyclopophantes TaxID=1041766 RepID=A0A5E6MEH2_9BACT|nr:apolipoprotein N-acyltransferase [Methylacidimicrobium cyclopophantes]VVM06756.1 Apolipoprotein N-acyltransferase [Methylacidimicrobium cyclopophantes]